MEALGFAMALQFKPDGKGGWLYRKDQTAAPVPATQAERDSYVRWYGWIVLGSLPLLMALIIGQAFVLDQLLPSPTNTQGMLATIPMVVIAFGVTYAYLKWFSHAPARAFADRPRVGEPTTMKQVHGAVVARMTWGKLVTRIGALMVLCAFAAFSADVPDADRPAAIAFALGVPAVIGLAFAWWKWRIDSGAA